MNEPRERALKVNRDDVIDRGAWPKTRKITIDYQRAFVLKSFPSYWSILYSYHWMKRVFYSGFLVRSKYILIGFIIEFRKDKEGCDIGTQHRPPDSGPSPPG